MIRGISQTPITDVAAYAASLGAEVTVGSGDLARIVYVRPRTRDELRHVEAHLSWQAARGRWPRGGFALRMVTP